MTNTTKRRIASVERYANALFQLAKEAKVLETVSSELTKLRNLMEQDINMMSVVQNPSISKNRKINFFNLLSEKIEMSKLTNNFIGVIVKKNRVKYLLEIINSFDDLLSNLKGKKNATITSAKDLSEKEIKDIKSHLKDKFNSDFNIKIIVDKSLIGGLKIQVGSQMIDSSIKNQLQLLKEKMKEVA